MYRDNLQWRTGRTLSKQVRQGQPISKPFEWALDDDGAVHVRSSHTRRPQVFRRDDYRAMLAHIAAHPEGIPLGARRDGSVPRDSLGALMEQRKGEGIRGWCSHLAAIAVQRGHIAFEDRGPGPGRGIWLYPIAGRERDG